MAALHGRPTPSLGRHGPLLVILRPLPLLLLFLYAVLLLLLLLLLLGLLLRLLLLLLLCLGDCNHTWMNTVLQLHMCHFSPVHDYLLLWWRCFCRLGFSGFNFAASGF